MWRRLFDTLAPPIPAMIRPSTARRPKRTVRRRAEKGGGGAGDRSLARRPHHENPRYRRRSRTPNRHRRDARPSRRRSGCGRLDRRCPPAPAWPQTPPTTATACAASSSSAAPSRSSRTTQPARTSIPSTICLSATQSHRAHVLPPQGLETHRNALRQARSQLRRSLSSRSRHHLVDLIESGA